MKASLTKAIRPGHAKAMRKNKESNTTENGSKERQEKETKDTRDGSPQRDDR